MTVHVIGNATVDITYRVPSLPRRGETLLARTRLVDAGGKGLNQAIVAARAGAPVCFTASIGDDAGAAILRRVIAAERAIEVAWIGYDGASDESVIVVDDTGHNLIVSTDGAAASLDHATLAPAFARMASGDVLLMQGNLAVELTRAALVEAKSRALDLILNPAPLRAGAETLLDLVDLLVVNEVEAVDLVGNGAPDMLLERLSAGGPSRVALTLGGEGCLVRETDGVHHIAAPRVQAVDTAGAGDVFTGVLTAALASGMTMLAAATWAVAAASCAVTRAGTSSAFPTTDELRELRS